MASAGSALNLVIRGRALLPRATAAAFDLLPDALIEIDAIGRITSIGPAPAGCGVPETHPGAVLLPGFVDTHIHFPQTRVIGSASGPLLPWLRRSVFPEEARFAETEYAAEVAREFCASLVAQGTTSAAIFSSSHPSATDTLFSELSRTGLRAMTGLTLMDRGAPDSVLLQAKSALEACVTLIDRWHDHDRGRLRFSIVPRFALSCTPELLLGAADLAKRKGLWIQTHISENEDELIAAREMFPAARDYLGIYEDHQLVGERTILAHAIWLSTSEWDRVAKQDARIAHCPDSNFFLGSGCMPLHECRSRGIRVGLGTDMGAGRTFSIRRVAASAYDASLIVKHAAAPEELLWLATAGGAQAIGLGDSVGMLAKGFEADVVAVDAPAGGSKESLIDALLFRHDAGPVRATYVRGKRLTAR